MNRFYALKNVANYARNSKSLLPDINLCQLSFPNVNLLHKNKHFISNLEDYLKEFLQKQKEFETPKEQPKNNTKNIKPQKKQDPYANLYSQKLKKLAKQFSQQTAFYVAPLQHSRTYHYASYFLPTVRILHSKKLIKQEKLLTNVYRQVKESIKPGVQKFFTPQSVVRILQQFSMIDFDGDESLSLDTMLNYAKNNMMYFTQVQWQRFKAAYKEIMVNKAMGPVKFKPLTIEKNYQSQAERKNVVIRENLQKLFSIPDHDIDKQIILNEKLDKKWVIIKVPSKKLTILTYPKSLLLQQQQAYSYIYDIKQTINTIVAKTLRQKNRLLLQKLKVNIFMRQYLQNNDDSSYQHLIQKGLVYRQKKQIVDEFQKYEEMKKMSLKEKIEKMKQKKKELKQKQKFKEKNKNIENPAKLQNKNKQFDFFQTLKYSLKQIQEQTLQKLNKTKVSNEIPKKKKKKAAKLQQKMQQNDQQLEDQEEQVDQQDEVQDENPKEEKITMNSAMIEKMKVDLQTFNKRVAQKQQKSLKLKKQKPQLPQIQSFIKVQSQQITIEKILNNVLSRSSLQQIKEFNAYVQMIQSFNDIMDEIDKTQRVKDYIKRVQQIKKGEVQKGIISEKRFRLIRDQLNESLDTRVELNSTLEDILLTSLQNAQKQGSIKKLNKNTQTLDHTIIILSEEQLLNSIKASQRKEIMRNNKISDKDIQKQDAQQIQLKEKIFKQSFLSN